jgi:hypothetical protein
MSTNSRLHLAAAAALAACQLYAQTPQPKAGRPLNGLTAQQLARFQAGRQDFTRVMTVQDGLGPIFNQTSCASCHNNPVGGPGSITVTRFGFTDGKGNFDPLTALGGSLLQQGAINPACSETVPAAANTTATRVTTSSLGIGLIEAIPDAAIAARELAPPSASVSGRVHWVHQLENPTGPLRAGRFGWKSQLATVLSFSGDAAQNELGLTNRLLPTENAPNGSAALLQQFDTRPDPEAQPDPATGRDLIDRLTDYQRYLAAPPQTPRSGMTGEALFVAVGCADCHAAAYTTSGDPALEPALRNQAIRPYSDFLLHDMGTAADFIPDGDASGQEIRTPPLWGVRTKDPLWHDGRVAGGTLQTRILGPNGVIFQHAAFGSESAASAAAFNNLSTAQKQQVVAFLDSLGRLEFDANGDGARNALDLPAFLAARAGAGGPYTADQPQAVFDFNQDGFVGQADLDAFAQVFEGDCNGNAGNDLLDVVSGASADANENLVPDECENCQPDLGFAGAGTFALRLCGDTLGAFGARATFELSGGPANGLVLVAIGVASNPTPVSLTEVLVPLLPLHTLVTSLQLDANGRVRVPVVGAGNPPTQTWFFQGATFGPIGWDLSNAIQVTVGTF